MLKHNVGTLQESTDGVSLQLSPDKDDMTNVVTLPLKTFLNLCLHGCGA